MEKEKKNSGKRLRYWLLAIVLVAALVFSLIKFFNFFGQQGPCPEPENLTVVNTDTTAITIQWMRSTNALQYRVEIRDSVNLDAILQDTLVTDTNYTFRELEQGRGYEMSVRALCVGDSSSVAKIGGATEGRIIIEDVTHFEGPDCPESCDTAIGLNNNCFSWVAVYGVEFYEVNIIDNSSLGGSSPAVRFHFVKKRDSGTNDLYIWTNSKCSIFASSIGAVPSECAPGSGSLCGTIGASLSYQLNFNLSGCCIVLPPGYSAAVKRCTIDQ